MMEFVNAVGIIPIIPIYEMENKACLKPPTRLKPVSAKAIPAIPNTLWILSTMIARIWRFCGLYSNLTVQFRCVPRYWSVCKMGTTGQQSTVNGVQRSTTECLWLTASLDVPRLCWQLPPTLSSLAPVHLLEVNGTDPDLPSKSNLTFFSGWATMII